MDEEPMTIPEEFERSFDGALTAAQQEALAAGLPKVSELCIQLRLANASWREIAQRKIIELGLYPLTDKDHRALMAMIGREIAKGLVETARREETQRASQRWSTRSAIVMIGTSILALIVGAIGAGAAWATMAHHP